eukprot:740645-Prymnesium_polylepis.1
MPGVHGARPPPGLVKPMPPEKPKKGAKRGKDAQHPPSSPALSASGSVGTLDGDEFHFEAHKNRVLE